jgi:hypothetical protein
MHEQHFILANDIVNKGNKWEVRLETWRLILAFVW